MPATPKDAAAIILLKNPSDPLVFWVQRNPRLAFMGGFHAFPGGQLDPNDATVPVLDADRETATMKACAARELFEETGVLLASSPFAGGELRTKLETLRHSLSK